MNHMKANTIQEVNNIEKTSFVLYTKFDEIFSRMSDEDAGILIKSIFDYVKTGSVPSFNEEILNMAFIPIRQALDENLEKWEAKKKARSEAGKRGGIASGKSRRRKAEANSAAAVPELEIQTDGTTGSSADSVAKEAVERMNRLIESTYKADDPTVKRVQALLNSGFTADDIFYVIDRKFAEWHSSETMRPNFRPSVLFNPEKFSEYVNAPISLAILENNNLKEKLRKRKKDLAVKKDALESIKDSLSKVDRVENPEEYNELLNYRQVLEDEIPRLEEQIRANETEDDEW